MSKRLAELTSEHRQRGADSPAGPYGTLSPLTALSVSPHDARSPPAGPFRMRSTALPPLRSVSQTPSSAGESRIKHGELDVTLREAADGATPAKQVLRLGTMDSAIVGHNKNVPARNPLADALHTATSSTGLTRPEDSAAATALPPLTLRNMVQSGFCRLLAIVLLVDNLLLVGIMALLVATMSPVFVPAPVFAGGNLGDLQIVRTEIQSPRTDAALQLVTNHGISLSAAANRNIVLSTSGTGAVVAGSIALAGASLTASAPLQLQSSGDVTLAPATRLVSAQGSLLVTGGLSAATLSAAGQTLSGTLTANSLVAGSLSASGGLTASQLIAQSAFLSGTLTSNAVSTSGTVSSAALSSSGALTGASATLAGALVAGSLSTAGAVTAAAGLLSGHLETASLSVTGALTAASALTAAALTAGSVSTAALTATQAVAAGVSVTGALTANAAAVTGLLSGGAVSSAGALTAGPLQAASLSTAGAATAATLSAAGGITAGSLSTGGTVSAASLTVQGAAAVGGSVTAASFAGIGIVPIGAIVAHYVDLSGADSLAAARAAGFATCDGTTAASQGIASPVITGALPDLNGGKRFLRGTAPGSSGTMEADAMQGHIHSTATAGSHTHTVQSSGAHTHTELIFALSNCDWCGGCSFKSNDCTGRSSSTSTSSDGAHTHTLDASGDHTHTVSGPVTDGTNGTPRTANETRPSNMWVVWLMRVK